MYASESCGTVRVPCTIDCQLTVCTGQCPFFILDGNGAISSEKERLQFAAGASGAEVAPQESRECQ